MPEATAEKCEAMMKELLKMAKVKISNSGGLVAKGETHPFLQDFDTDIREIINEVVSIKKWNQIKDKSQLEVDFTGISIASNFDNVAPIYKVKGRIKFILTLDDNNSAPMNFTIAEFTQTDKGAVRNRIEREVKKESVRIISGLLNNLN
jgi:hypothetical protein